MPMIVRVALPVPLARLFDYLPPRHGQACAGSRVRVPFGRSSRIGIVVGQAPDSTLPVSQLKRVHTVLDDSPLLDTELLATLARAGSYWLGVPGEVYLGALPVTLRGGKPLPEVGMEAWSCTRDGLAALTSGRRRGRSQRLLEILQDGIQTSADINPLLPGWRDAARRLAKAELIEKHVLASSDLPHPAVAGPPLNTHQQVAVETVFAAGDGFHPFLLEGVTGSGKTEVYLTLMARALAAGRQVLMLVPEIGLAPQSVRRLRERLGREVEVLHSGLPGGERTRAWLRAWRGEACVVLGTRSAIFTPLPRAGLIVVDEEHDTSYKQQDGFRYHARDLAMMRAQALDIPIVLGSATPSLETLANVETGRYQRLHLPSRAGAGRQPQVRIIDVRAQRLQGGLGPALLDAIRQTVTRGEQALVFRNRLGYAPVLLCHGCGWHAECPRCTKPMTLHAQRARLTCHHCGRERPVPQACPECGNTHLRAQGFGTERLEEALSARFPEVPVLRVDRDSMRHRHAFEEMLERLDADQSAILVGTQILAKGHDLPNLTLVAITDVDGGLHSVDFRAAERLAQLVVQVAGRAGRAHKPGHVLLQTHHPEHPFLRTLLNKGYAACAIDLLAERRLLQLPPWAHQALLRVEARDLAAVDAFLASARDAVPQDDAVRILGPMPAPMSLRAGRHRGQLLLEADRRAQLQAMLHPWRDALQAQPQARKVRWSIDVDPVDLY